ncbi:OmpA family protein [Bacteroides clarus YIT 12056]|uniref:DUF3575 domain-containing protein n=1 Tax=Bacteroides clarus YIT 12056 TaxID=762984 RepID=A0ABN0CRS1_9BACE|nr:DUF3575 domain-containing protein [Bacteroides clarus]EGF54256.1 hypothetical protein HMPREF9445_00605 [Bacteroides clarus YIT 12056]SHH06974.1 OmpA family protein [Bacteroides clarus YIT 12056]
MNLKLLLIIGFMQVLPFPIYSQEARETKKEVFSADTEQKTELVLHFRFDRSMVDYGYRDNNRILAAMHKIFADSLCVSRIDSVCIQAFSSPEGDADYNRRLALRRAQAVKGYLVWKYPGLNQYRIRTSAQAESWDALRDVALNDTLLPCRDEILQILKLNTGEKRKEALLKKLNTGIPYRHISQWILPELRNASICTVYMRPLRHAQQGSRLVADAQGNNMKEYQKADGAEITDDTEVVNGVRVEKGNDTNANGTEVINGVRVAKGDDTNANGTEVINDVRVTKGNDTNANGTEVINGVRVTKDNDTNANGTEVINGVRVAKGNDTNPDGTKNINGVRVAKGNDTNANGTELTDNTEITGSTQVTGNTPTKGSANAIAPGKSRRRPLFAVKTNLLFDAALMPNIELEVPIGKRWSLNGEYMFPWWLINDDRYCLQILMGGLEVRYRPGKRSGRDVLTGHFIGLYAGGGKYDLQWDKNGYQGEFFIAAGVSYGYAHSIARNLRLEYNIGIGMLRTDYRHYHSRDNHRTLLWQENGEYTWLGPTKLKISLVWLITGKNKK